MPKKVETKSQLDAFVFAAHLSGNRLSAKWRSDINNKDIIELTPTAYLTKDPEAYTPFDRLCWARDRMKEKLPKDNSLLALLNQLIAHAEDMSRNRERSSMNEYWRGKEQEINQLVDNIEKEIAAIFPENDVQKQRETAALLSSELPTLMNVISLSPPPPVLTENSSETLARWKNELSNVQPNDPKTPNLIMHILVENGDYDYFVPRFEVKSDKRSAFQQAFLMARLEANDAAKRFAADPIARETYLYKPSCFRAYIEKSVELDKELSPLRKAADDARQASAEGRARRSRDEKMELLRSLLAQDKTISLDTPWNDPKQQIKGSEVYQTMMKNALKLYQKYREGRGAPTAEESAALVEDCIAYTKGKKSRRFFASGRERFTRCQNLAAAFADDVTDPEVRAKIDTWVKRVNEVRGVTDKKDSELYFNINAYGTHGAKPGAAKASALLDNTDGVAPEDQAAYSALVRELATRHGFTPNSEAAYDPDTMLDREMVLSELAARKTEQARVDAAQKVLTDKETELQPQRNSFINEYKKLEYNKAKNEYYNKVRSYLSKLENKVQTEEQFFTAMKEDDIALENLFKAAEAEDQKYQQALKDRQQREEDIKRAKNDAAFERSKLNGELAQQDKWVEETITTSAIELPILKTGAIEPQARKQDYDAILKTDGVPDGNPQFQKLVEHANAIWSKMEQKLSDQDMLEDKKAMIEAAKNVLFDPKYHANGHLTTAGKQALGIFAATLGVQDAAMQKVYIGAMQVAGNIFENVRAHGELFDDLKEACNPRKAYSDSYLIGTKFSSSYLDLNGKFCLKDADITLKEAQQVCISRYQAAKKAGDEAEAEKFRKAVHTCVITRTAHHLNPPGASTVNESHLKALREDPEILRMADGMLDGGKVETKLAEVGKYAVNKLMRKEVTIPEPLSDNGHPSPNITPNDYLKLLDNRVQVCMKKLNDSNATRKEKIQATHLINHCTLTKTLIELRFADKSKDEGFTKKELKEIKTRVTDICKDRQSMLARADHEAAKNSIGKIVLEHFEKAVYTEFDATRPYHGTFYSSNGAVTIGDGEEYYPSHYEKMKKPQEYLNAPGLADVKQSFPEPNKMFTYEQGVHALAEQGIHPPKDPFAEQEPVKQSGVSDGAQVKKQVEAKKETAPTLG